MWSKRCSSSNVVSSTPPSTTATGHHARRVNVGQGERLASVAAGAALALYGLGRRSLGGLVLAAVGAALGWRGITGHCALYEALDVDRSAPGPVQGNLGTKIDRHVTVNVPRARVFRIWRNFTNLPRIMSHLERVEALTPIRSRWVLKAPVGTTVEWEAEIINEQVVELYDHRFLNHEVPPFDKVVPTPENIARDIWERLEPHVNARNRRLHLVRLYETPDLYVDYAGGAGKDAHDPAH